MTRGPRCGAGGSTDPSLERALAAAVAAAAAELDAARTAGMATALAVRPGNGDPGGIVDHEPVASFAEIVT